MKNALKIAFPTILAFIITYSLIESAKWIRARYLAEEAMKKQRIASARAAAAAAAEVEPEEDHTEVI